jgi:hypothetical protein
MRWAAVTELSQQYRSRSDLRDFVLMFWMLYVGFGLASPFFPAFLTSRGATPEQIRFLLSVSGCESACNKGPDGCWPGLRLSGWFWI